MPPEVPGAGLALWLGQAAGGRGFIACPAVEIPRGLPSVPSWLPSWLAWLSVVVTPRSAATSPTAAPYDSFRSTHAVNMGFFQGEVQTGTAWRRRV